MHLRSRQEHGEKCTEKACATGCGFRRLEEWLAAPLTERDALEDERIRERREALWRGEIPA
ncbi:hypothetical protein OG989_04075 [Micromonospora sp. NBC_01740]|uniref:hypothetical protein n=1 Tax=Micromonospora sp. NBC_01740 TaxID=2975986 RepID=UPI002E0E69EB|nr:hypothetical protein OG989_04075 [Micromonospora sp. NBC_01740]